MNAKTLCRSLAMASLVASGMAWWRWERALRVTPPNRVSGVPLRPHEASVPDSALVDAEESIVGNDPFRLSNVPPTRRFDPVPDATGIVIRSPVLAAPRPALVLKAIVGGPPWQAVIDGIPGQPSGTIAREGSTFEQLTIRAVTRDSVIVQGPDTSWVLSFKGRS